MVSKISDPETRVVSPAAYLLFYRRRSSEPLGPQYLRELVQTARNAPDNASANSSDDELAGEGNLGGPRSSRLLGSSSDGAKAGVGAGAQQRQSGVANLHLRAPDGGVGGLGASAQSPSARRNSDDEGVSMFEDEQPPSYTAIQSGGWDFEGLNDDRASDGGRSDMVNVDSDAGETLRDDTDDENRRRGTPVDDLFGDDEEDQKILE